MYSSNNCMYTEHSDFVYLSCVYRLFGSVQGGPAGTGTQFGSL